MIAKQLRFLCDFQARTLEFWHFHIPDLALMVQPCGNKNRLFTNVLNQTVRDGEYACYRWRTEAQIRSVICTDDWYDYYITGPVLKFSYSEGAFLVLHFT